jgi:hypothetical protein
MWRIELLAAGLALAAALTGCSAAAAPSPAPSAPPAAMDTPQPTDAAVASPSDAAAATDSPSPAPVDACAVITMPEAAKVTGGKLGDPVPEGDPVTRCVWTAPPTGEVAQLEIDLGDGAKKSYDIDNSVLKHAFTAVAGLGDEAYAEDDAIFFRKGDTWVAIHLVRLNDASANAANLLALAKAVAARV